MLVEATFRSPSCGSLPRSRWDFPPAGSLPGKAAATRGRGLLKAYGKTLPRDERSSCPQSRFATAGSSILRGEGLSSKTGGYFFGNTLALNYLNRSDPQNSALFQNPGAVGNWLLAVGH